MALVADLQSRGLFYQCSDPDLDARLEALRKTGPVAAYAGFDPTADSLHVGNFVAILGLMYAQRNGLRPIAVVGGATGLIGDPGGKTVERELLSKETVGGYLAGIRRVLEKFLDFHHPSVPALIVNNMDWLGAMSAIDFLRDVGRHFRVGAMLARDSVRARMEASDEGLSFTEFSYQLLQAYDFYRLYKDHRCVLQIGGSDQWGNIMAGVDLVRRVEGESGNVFGLTMPLITDASGRKFGKSEGNAVWLTADRTSVFDFYQFWLRTEDADVERYLRLFTFLPLERIAAVAAEHRAAPEKRVAQRLLAREMTALVHGSQACEQAIAASQTMYGGSVQQLTVAAVQALAAQGVPTTTIPRATLEAGWPVVEAAVRTGLARGKSEARRLIQQGGLYVNNQAVSDVNAALGPDALTAAGAIVLRSGKRNYHLVRVD